MTSPATGLKNILAAEGTVLTGNWYARIGGLGDNPYCVALIDGSWNEPEAAVGIDYPSVQVITMAPAYEETYDKAQQVFDLLHRLPTPNSAYPDVDSCLAINKPAWLGRDDKDRARFSTNFRLIISPSNPGHRL